MFTILSCKHTSWLLVPGVQIGFRFYFPCLINFLSKGQLNIFIETARYRFLLTIIGTLRSYDATATRTSKITSQM